MKRSPIWNAAAGTLTAACLWATMSSVALATPQSFESPEAAVDAVVAALEAIDREALLAIFGAENEDVILTGDDAEDTETWREFLTEYRQLHRIGTDADSATLFIGRTLWPFPVTLERGEAGWSFDAEAARDEILLRRIGANELDVIALLEGYVRVQSEYRASDPDGDGMPSFASAILSDAGARNGLYWPPEPGAPESPIGDFMARAAAEGYEVDGEAIEAEPYLGYYYRVLTRQGEAAPGGALNYMVDGRMVAGHALLAFPAAYGETGVMSFMVGERGMVYEADLGPETLEVADAIEAFDPTESWSVVDEAP